CVAAHLHHQGQLPLGRLLRLGTDAGVRPATVLSSTPDTDTVTVEVDMGPVGVAAVPLTVNKQVTAIAVDVGNPHAVIFDPVPIEHRMEVVHAIEARTDVFPRGVNVEFVTVPSQDSLPLRVNVHERGVGWTRACGTGACAVAAAAVE